MEVSEADSGENGSAQIASGDANVFPSGSLFMTSISGGRPQYSLNQREQELERSLELSKRENILD